MKALNRMAVAIAILNLGLICSVAGQDTAPLIKQLASWNKNKARKASDQLAAMGAKVVPELIEALNGKIRRQRRFAARTLREFGQDAANAVPALSKALGDSDALTREYSVEAPGKMANQADQVIPLLKRAAKDSDHNVSGQARAAIAHLAELRKSQGQTVSLQAHPATNENAVAAIRTTDKEDVAQAEPSRPNNQDSKDIAASSGDHVSKGKTHSFKDGLLELTRYALFPCVIAGFFALLYVYRDEPQ